MVAGLLPGVRVLDVGRRISGPYCGKILAQLGAEVIRVEPPEGDEARRMGPFPGDVANPESSGLFLAVNANKYGVTLDLSTSEGARKLRKLAETADILIENFGPGVMGDMGLGYEVLGKANPGLIYTSITPFGTWGPYAGFKASDLVLFHISGHAHELSGPVEDTDVEPAIRAGGHQAEFLPGMAAATATVMALYRKRITGLGCHIELSSFEAMVNQLISRLARCAYGRPGRSRDLKETTESPMSVLGAVGGVLLCNDGYVAISPREDAQWQRWLEVMGEPDWGTDERFATREAREENASELWELLGRWSRQHSKQQIARWGQERRIPCFPVNNVEDLFKDEHLAQRGFFIEMSHPVAGALRYPGAAYRLANTRLPLAARPAPLLGQHNKQILVDMEVLD